MFLLSPALSAEGETSVMWQEPVFRLAEIMLDDEECGRPCFEDDAAGACGRGRLLISEHKQKYLSKVSCIQQK